MQGMTAGTMACSALLVFSTTVHAQKMKLREVLVLDVTDTRPDGSPGQDAYLFQADRGSRKGQFALARTMDERAAARLAGDPRESYEYHLLSPDTVGALPEVDVLGIHYIKVRPDRREAFERFVAQTLHPAVANLRPDLRVMYYKSARGPDAGNYIALFALTRESRDKYWPGGSDSDALRAAFEPVRPLTKELSTYLVEGSYLADEKFAAAVYESREWTDFVQVPAASR
jgi:hypothetical protein